MEDKRSFGSGFFDVEDTTHARSFAAPPRKLSPLSWSAGFAVIILASVIGWNIMHGTATSNPSPVAQAQMGDNNVGDDQVVLPTTSAVSATSTQDLSGIGQAIVGTVAQEYAALEQQGDYSTSTAAAAAAQLAPAIQAPLSYPTFAASDLTITQDVSQASIKQYQAAIRQALAPLSKNTTPEISIFSDYVQTGDQTYLTQLRAVANDYAEAAEAASKVQVPANAVQQHVAILNAMEEFSATLEALADNASDPFATMAALNTYNDAEAAMAQSFDQFAAYIQAQHLSS